MTALNCITAVAREKAECRSCCLRPRTLSEGCFAVNRPVDRRKRASGMDHRHLGFETAGGVAALAAEARPRAGRFSREASSMPFGENGELKNLRQSLEEMTADRNGWFRLNSHQRWQL